MVTSLKEQLAKRLSLFFKEKKLVKSHVARKLGKKQENINRWLNGKHAPDAEAIVSIIKVFPSLNARWYLTGEGEMESEFQALHEHEKFVVECFRNIEIDLEFNRSPAERLAGDLLCNYFI